MVNLAIPELCCADGPPVLQPTISCKAAAAYLNMTSNCFFLFFRFIGPQSFTKVRQSVYLQMESAVILQRERIRTAP